MYFVDFYNNLRPTNYGLQFKFFYKNMQILFFNISKILARFIQISDNITVKMSNHNFDFMMGKNQI